MAAAVLIAVAAGEPDVPWGFVPCNYTDIGPFAYQFGPRAVRCTGDGCGAIQAVTGVQCTGTTCIMQLYPPLETPHTLKWHSMRCTCDPQNDIIGCEVSVHAHEVPAAVVDAVGLLLGLLLAVFVLRIGGHG